MDNGRQKTRRDERSKRQAMRHDKDLPIYTVDVFFWYKIIEKIKKRSAKSLDFVQGKRNMQVENENELVNLQLILDICVQASNSTIIKLNRARKGEISVDKVLYGELLNK